MFFSASLPEPLIIAHRGCRSLAPENTLAACRAAKAAGADGWELDVQLSKDGEVILLHDLGLLRTTDAGRHPAFRGKELLLPNRFTLAELKRLSAGSHYALRDRFRQIREGNVPPEALAAFEHEPIPTLREALALSRELGLRVNVEIKDLRNVPGGDAVLERVCGVLDEFGMEDRIIISSFNHDYVARIKKLRPAYATGALTRGVKGDPVQLLRALEADAWHPGRRYVLPEQIRAVREAGFHVNVYTVNEPEEMQRLAAAGASGLVTDFPQRAVPLFRN